MKMKRDNEIHSILRVCLVRHRNRVGQLHETITGLDLMVRLFICLKYKNTTISVMLRRIFLSDVYK